MTFSADAEWDPRDTGPGANVGRMCRTFTHSRWAPGGSNPAPTD